MLSEGLRLSVGWGTLPRDIHPLPVTPAPAPRECLCPCPASRNPLRLPAPGARFRLCREGMAQGPVKRLQGQHSRGLPAHIRHSVVSAVALLGPLPPEAVPGRGWRLGLGMAVSAETGGVVCAAARGLQCKRAGRGGPRNRGLCWTPRPLPEAPSLREPTGGAHGRAELMARAEAQSWRARTQKAQSWCLGGRGSAPPG